jgi:Domain of unknown function (DUF4954)/Domain of unknown function (DUF6819)
MDYRQLTRHEIASLEKQGCVAEDWSRISVNPDFSPDNIRNVMFAGDVKIGLFNDTVEIEPGILKHTGIYDSCILNCFFGDNVYVSNVDNLVNYDIRNNVIIENVNTLAVSGENTFGNGTEIDIVNEKANRTLLIYDQLTAQIAYMFVFYRHDKAMIKHLEAMIRNYVESKKSGQGIIGEGARILNTRTIRNVNIGEYALISGTTHLEDGTISCTKEEPAIVGGDVIAIKFIILSGSIVDSASYLEKCFIGQGVIIGRMFSAENSAFFANCEGLNGEALSIFAGPYTVSHHKSTLLIAALYSFFNAGSASNQSNHMYKLGPVHQGVLERGVKTGSFSYFMWPSRIGAFTVVIGKHFVQVDTSPFPFSYMVESGGKSLLLPALNLFTVGTLRDSSKWQPRDRRQIGHKLDLICFDLFNPYIVGKILEGITILRKIDEEVPLDQETADYKGVNVRRKKLDHSINQYEHAVKIFIGNEVIKMLEMMGEKATFKEIREYLSKNGTTVSDRWTDMAGMVAPMSAIEVLLSDIKSEKIKTVNDLADYLEKVHNNYQKYCWTWCMKLISDFYRINISEIKQDQLIMIISAWKDSLSKQTESILQDAGKEYDDKRRIGYGIDGDEKIRDEDFDEVRGKFEHNKFIIDTKNEFEKTLMKCERLTSMINSLA